MADVGTAFVSIVPSARGFGRELASQTSSDVALAGKSGGKTYGGTFSKSAGSALKLAGIATLSSLVLDQVKTASDDAREAARVAAVTANTIKTTGGAAKVSAKHVADLATAIMKKTAIDDDSVAVGANQLLTFKAIRNEVGQGNQVFDRATQAAVDLSAHGFGSIDSAAVQLGKALQDPVKGITALGRSGITFTAQEKQQIKTLVEHGKTLQAQKIILKSVEEQVGGTAAAQATNVDKLSASLKELRENAGGDINTKLNGLAGNLLKLGPVLKRANSEIEQHPRTLGNGFNALRGAIDPLEAAINVLSTDTGKLKKDLARDWANIKSKVSSGALGAARNAGTAFGLISSQTGISMRISRKNIDNGVASIRRALSKLPGIGKNSGLGFSTGLTGVLDRLVTKVHSKIDSLVAEFNKALKINSPSKVFKGIGSSVGEGFQVGMEKSFQDVTASARVIALAPASAVKDVQETAAAARVVATPTGPIRVWVDNVNHFDARSERVANGVLADASQFAGVVGRMA